MKIRLRNLTPHPVIMAGPHGIPLTYAPETPTPRVAEVREYLGVVHEGTAADEYIEVPLVYPLYRVRLGAVSDLPDEEPGVRLIVSRMVAEARPDRRDLLIPYDLIRDDQGRIKAARAFSTIGPPEP